MSIFEADLKKTDLGYFHCVAKQIIHQFSADTCLDLSDEYWFVL